MRVPYHSAEDIEYWWDVAYEVGFDDGLEGRAPALDQGDLSEPYMSGYEDGRNSRA